MQDATDSSGSSRSTTVSGARGVVSAGSPAAVEVATAVLGRGGNAVDAAIAAAVTQCVVEFPWCGIGGDLFMLVDRPGEGVTAVNGSGAAPGLGADGLTIERLPRFGPLSVAVPGLVATQQLAHERFGVLSAAELFAPAIELARHGFALDHRVATAIAQLDAGPRPGAGLTDVLDGNGRLDGETFRQTELADTLESIAKGGAEWFYRGEFADRLDRQMREDGGLLRSTDLATHEPSWSEPLCVGYRDLEVYQHPPVSMGMLMLAELGILEQFDPDELDDPVARTALMVRCKMAAFTELRAGIALSREEVEDRLRTAVERWPRERLESFTVAPDGPAMGGNDTTSLVVQDADGTTVTAIHSLFNTFGSREVIAGTGVLLNDRLASLRIAPGPGPRYLPGERPAHTLNSFIAKRDGRTVIAAATPGGRGQVQTNFQVLVNHVDLGMSPTEALDQPRWLHGTPRQPVDDGVLHVESHYTQECLAGLREADFELSVREGLDNDLFGSVTAAGADTHGTGGSWAAADFRRGAACGAC